MKSLNMKSKFKNINLLIVGVGGVGKEHIRAAYNLGIENLTLCDTSPKVAREYALGIKRGCVINKWDRVRERINLPRDTEFIRDFKDTKREITHIIVATPTHSHLDIVRSLRRHYKRAKILLEKPISDSKEKIKVDYVGYQYDFKFKDGENVLILCNSKRQPDMGDIKHDLLSHLIYLSLKNKRGIREVEVINKNFCYATTKKGDVLMALRNKPKHYVLFNEVTDVNYSKLFTEQLKRFLIGKSNYKLALKVESYL